MFLFFFFFNLWLCCTACGILVPWPGIEPAPSALEVWRVNHWTAREVLEQSWIKSDVKNQWPLCWIQPASAFLGLHRVLNIGAIQKWRIAHQIWIFSFSWETRVSGNRGSSFLKLARAELRFFRALWFTPCQSSPRTEAKIRCSVHPPYTLPSLMIKSLIIIHCMVFLTPASLHSFMLLILALKILGNKEV